MRYKDIVASASEAAKDRAARLELMYGVGATDAEKDGLEVKRALATAKLDRAKAHQAQADAVAALKRAALLDPQELDEAYPWPSPGNRSLTEAERDAVWTRCSRIAGEPLPRWPTLPDC